MKRSRIAALALLPAFALGTLWGADAAAKGKHADKDKSASSIDAQSILADLQSGDEARIIAALEAVSKAGEKAKDVVPLVEALLRRGANPKILEKALKAAGDVKQPSSSAAIAPYVAHRDQALRRGAARALAKTGGPDAVKALRHALRSPDPAVRGTAASGLGSLGAHDALPDLFIALDHNVGEAAASVGQLCEPDECEQFASRTGKLAFDVMTAGYDQILFRPEDKMTEDEKIRIIGRIRELGTAEAGKYLADVASRWPKNWSKRVKQAIDAAVKATGGAEAG